MKMLKEVEEYWTRRAESYSDVVCHELNHSNEKSWMDVILKEIPEDKKIKIADMGTGPGFFAISLAKRGYDVTAVDYTQEMLNHAMQTAGTYASRITWMRGDVQNLENIQDGSFDVIVTRNLTWNLEEPQKAYQEWCRVLKKGGILLNFDAGWYNYLFDDKQKNAFEEDHRLLLIGITFLSFLLVYHSPGDPAMVALKKSGMRVSEKALELKREELGLNDPFAVQYGRWLNEFFHGDLGESYKTGKAVAGELKKTIPATLLLTVAALALTILISFPIGVLCAKYKDRGFDNMIRFVTYFLSSLPSFFLALLMMYVLSMKLQLLPVIGSVSGKGIIMPALVLALTLSAWYIRQIRGIVLQELEQEYVDGLKSRGASENRILFFHVLKNCMLPIVTLLGMSFGTLLGGSAIVETIFSWPGVGRLAVTSISARDYPVIQAYVVWMAMIYLLINAAVEFLCQILVPRVRREKSAR